jgi:surface antigen
MYMRRLVQDDKNKARRRRPALRLLALALWLPGLALSACSTAPSLVGAVGDVETTGSLASPRSLAAWTGEADAASATVALDKALDPHAAGNPVNWTGESAGRSGSFAAVGEAYLQDDRLCRGFVASIAEDGSRTWMRGAACRMGAGPWSLAAMAPFDARR